ASVERALARLVPRDRRVNRTGPDAVEPYGLQLHAALAARAGLVLDDVLVARHRADVRDGRQRLGALRLGRHLPRSARADGDSHGNQDRQGPAGHTSLYVKARRAAELIPTYDRLLTDSRL